jgi:hypothetical protein
MTTDHTPDIDWAALAAEDEDLFGADSQERVRAVVAAYEKHMRDRGFAWVGRSPEGPVVRLSFDGIPYCENCGRGLGAALDAPDKSGEDSND